MLWFIFNISVIFKIILNYLFDREMVKIVESRIFGYFGVVMLIGNGLSFGFEFF